MAVDLTDIAANNHLCEMPSTYVIEPCTLCNLNCVFCPTGTRAGRLNPGMLGLDDYAVMLEKIAPYAREINLYNYGEPFLNPAILDMVSMAAVRNIGTIIHSNLNARLFESAEARMIAESGLTILSASIDGASQESYGKYRRGGSFDLAIRNVAAVQRAKEETGSAFPRVMWSFLINRFNEHEIGATKRMASELGVETVFSLMNVAGNGAWESTYHRDPLKLTRLQNNEKPAGGGQGVFARMVRGSKRLFGRKMASDSPEEIPSYQPAGIGLDEALPYWCAQPFTTMIVNYDGNVFPCCTISDDRMSLGNILTTDLEAVWNSDAFRRCREFLVNYRDKRNVGSVCEAGLCCVRSRW